MTAETLTRYEITVEDVEYMRHGDRPLLARIYKPRGTGPFPLVVDLHGGAWCNKDRTTDAGTDEPLAKSGVVVVALDFRMPPKPATRPRWSISTTRSAGASRSRGRSTAGPIWSAFSASRAAATRPC